SVSDILLPLIQSRHSPSATPRSKRGPTNRIAVRIKAWATSEIWTGHQPRSLRASESEALLFSTMSHRTAKVLTMQDRVTALILARMTEGASRLRVADGLVAEEI